MGLRVAYIDGASLDRATKDLATALEVDDVPFVHQSFFQNLGVERVFYYDALPAKKNDESKADYEARTEQKEAHLNALRMIPRTAVRLGKTRRGGSGAQRQKGVDVFLATDALRHAYERLSEHATFVLSDLDFYPVFEALAHTRVTAALYYRVGHTADDLLHVAHFASPLSQSLLLRSCESSFAARFAVVETGQNGPLTSDEWALAARGDCQGQSMFLWNNPGGHGVCCWFNGIRSEAPTRELALERWMPATRIEIEFSDGWVYRARSK